MEGTGNRTRRRSLGNDRQAAGQGAPHDASCGGDVGPVGEPSGAKATFGPGQTAQGDVFGVRDMDPPGVIGWPERNQPDCKVTRGRPNAAAITDGTDPVGPGMHRVRHGNSGVCRTSHRPAPARVAGLARYPFGRKAGGLGIGHLHQGNPGSRNSRGG